MFKSEVEVPLFLNKIRTTKAIANKEYLMKNYEKAALLCQEILDQNSHDLDNRIMLSKCQREMFQFKLAEKNHFIAKEKYPDSSKVLENEACHLFEHCDFERSINIFSQGNKKMDIDQHFKMEVGKLDQVYNGIFELNNSKYQKNHLGNIVEKFVQQDNLGTLIYTKDFYTRNNLTRKRHHALYLGSLNAYQKHIARILRSRNTIKHPFIEEEKNMYSDMELIINAADMVEEQLNERRAFYLFRCDVKPLRAERRVTHTNNLNISKDMHHLQVVKYFNIIIQLILKNKIEEAKKKTELMINYMKKVHYNCQNVLNEIYRTFGAVQYLLFQNIDQRDEKHNQQRILSLFGAIEDTFSMQESLYGSCNFNIKVVLTQLLERMKISKSILEKVYLHFELTRCYTKVKMLKRARFYANHGLKLAEEAHCQAWICNLLILMASIDFQLAKNTKFHKELKRAIVIAHVLEVPGVKNFLETVKSMIEIIPELGILKLTPLEKKKINFESLMTNKSQKIQAVEMFRRSYTKNMIWKRRNISILPDADEDE